MTPDEMGSREILQDLASYPSTMLRMVPLPMLRMGRISAPAS